MHFYSGVDTPIVESVHVLLHHLVVHTLRAEIERD